MLVFKMMFSLYKNILPIDTEIMNGKNEMKVLKGSIAK